MALIWIEQISKDKLIREAKTKVNTRKHGKYRNFFFILRNRHKSQFISGEQGSRCPRPLEGLCYNTNKKVFNKGADQL